MEDSGISDATGQPQSLPAAAVNTVPSPLSNSSGSNGRSNRESPMSQSVDDSFTHVPPARMVSSVSKSQYSQVVFHDVSDLYPTDCDIKCRYTLTSDVSAQPGDKIALFKVGWTSVTEYITFTRAPQPTVGETTLAVTIKADKFPKETSDLYQLCYITSGNVIAGGSIPFSFHVPTEAELVAVEDPTDPGMVVFRSRVSQLQDNLQKKSDDYDQLLLKHTLLEGNVQLLKRELDSVDSSLKKSQDAFTDLFTSKQELEIDNKVLQERLIQFQQETHTIGKLEEELSQSQKELETLRRQFEENNKNLVAAKKENIELVANLSKNYEVAQEKARQVETLTSSVACLQQDCERTTQALKEQVKVVESLTAQNESLVEKLRTMAAKHNETVMQNIELNEKVRGAEKATADALKANNRLQSMVEELRNSNSGGTGESAHAARASKLAEEKEMLEVMLLTLEEEHAKCADQISNLTTQLSNLNVEPNRPTGPEQGNSHPNGPASSIFKVVRNATFGLLNGSPENAQSVSSNAPTTPPGSADESIEAVRSRLKAVREQKSVLGSELAILRHNMEIVESELKTLRQDHSAKKNRIEVLEIELRAAKDELTKLKKRKPEKASHSGANDHLEDVDAFKSGLPIIKKFNEQVAVLSLLQEKLDGERKENAELKNKVDDLLAKDVELCAELLDIREKFAAASNEVHRLREMPVRENFEMLNMALDNCEKSRKELEEKLMEEIQAKVKLEQQVTSLRAECVGKVSIDCSQQMQKRINSLEVQLDQQTKFTNYMKKFVHSTFNEQPTMPIRCPLCPTDFVPALRKTFAAHFKDQHMK